MTPGTGFQLSVLGNLGKSFALLASSNLRDWTAILKFTCTNIPMVLSDAVSLGTDRRFYRVAPLSAVPGPVLRFSSPISTNGTPITLALQGVPGFAYRIETSTNLLNWIPLTNFTSTNLLMYFQDVPNPTRKFYRAVTQ